MRPRTALFTSLSFATLLAFTGCGDQVLSDNGTDDPGVETSADDEYGDFFDVHYESMDGAVYAGDERDGDVDYEYTDDEGLASLPVAWGRQPSGPMRRSVETFYPDRNHAESTFRWTLNGRLYVDRSDDGVRNPGVKPFTDRWQRSARLVRAGGEEWRLTALTPSEITLAERETQTVFIERIDISVDGVEVLSVDNPRAFLAFPDELPYAEPGQSLRVEARVGNEDQTWVPAQWVFLHTQGPRPRDRADEELPAGRRYLMVDNGERGDRVAGDGIYTVVIEVQGERPLARVIVDVIAAQTLMTEFGHDYNSTAWGIPFLTRRPWFE